MKILSIALGVFMALPSYTTTHAQQKSKLSYHLFDHNNTPSVPLLDLLKLLSIKHNGTPQDILTKTQKAWLRSPGSERWQMKDNYTELKESVWKLLGQLGCTEKIEPSQTQYEYALILGATVNRVRTRLRDIITLWQNGIRFKKLVFLVGDRDLDPTIESLKILLENDTPHFPLKKDWTLSGSLPKTEYEMAKMVFDQAQLPADFEKVEIEFINTPKKLTPLGYRRPNTADTVHAWLQTNPKPGSCIAISNQPHVGYQNEVLHQLLPQKFPVETVGNQVSNSVKTSVILDSLTRWLYVLFG